MTAPDQASTPLGRVIAIDLGSTNTVVASADAGGAVQIIAPGDLACDAGPGTPPLVPSVVYVRDARSVDVLVGAAVARAGLDQTDDPRYITGFKRRIATRMTGLDPEVDGIEVSCERAAGWFLTGVLQAIDGLDRNRDTVVFTVPVGSFQPYLDWLEAYWPVRRWRVVDESTAAALGYGVAAPGRRVLTCDLGGGTVDLSLVRLPDDLDATDQPVAATVIAKVGQVLGGDDIDHWLLEHILRKVGLDGVDTDRPSLLRAAEMAKIGLSTSHEADFDAPHPSGEGRLRARVSRDELEDVLIGHDFLSRLQAGLETLLRQAERRGVSKDDIEHVLLVGGTSQVPAVRRMLQGNFGAARVRSEHVFTAAARGAARLGLGVSVRDFLYHSYAVRGWNHVARRHEYDLVVPALSPYPFAEPVVREYAASAPGQPAMELFLGEIEHGDVSRPEVIIEDRRVRVINAPMPAHRYALVDEDRVVPLNNGTVVPLDPPGHPGINRVRVIFSVDERRRLKLTAIDLQTNRTLLRDQPIALLT
ncbi:MAG: Hsp70 family protein [Armatimonadetes bacterium]|nr:Hsp70 family protein [Armatimonadota bacterium]